MSNLRFVPARYVLHLIGVFCQEKPQYQYDDVLRLAGIARNDLSAEGFITFDEQLKVYKFLHRAAEPGFGLRAGSQLPQGAHGQLGYAMLACSTVRDAFEIMRRFLRTQGPMLTLSLVMDGKLALVRASEIQALGEARLLAVEEQLAVWNYARLPAPIVVDSAIELRVDYPEPAHSGLYAEILTVPVRFGCDNVEAVLPAWVLDEPLNTANPDVLNVLTRSLDLADHPLEGTQGVVEQMRQALAVRPTGTLKLNQAAQLMHVSPRTFSRLLAQQGTSFRDEVSRHRMIVAEGYLRNTDIRVEEIASLLGYSDTANFHRAFVKWTNGTTPAGFRKGRDREERNPTP